MSTTWGGSPNGGEMFTANKNENETNETQDFFTSREDPLLSRKEAAKYMRMSPGSLAVIDCMKTYDLEPVKIGGRAYYYKSVLDKFLSRNLKP